MDGLRRFSGSLRGILQRVNRDATNEYIDALESGTLRDICYFYAALLEILPDEELDKKLLDILEKASGNLDYLTDLFEKYNKE